MKHVLLGIGLALLIVGAVYAIAPARWEESAPCCPSHLVPPPPLPPPARTPSAATIAAFGASTQPEAAPRPVQRCKELAPALIEALKDTDTDVRQWAAAALVGLGKDAVKPLVEALKDKDRELRANAAFVLSQMPAEGQDALPALVKALKDEDKEVRRRAAYAIQRIVKENGESRGGSYAPTLRSISGSGKDAPDPTLLMPSSATAPSSPDESPPDSAPKPPPPKDPFDKGNQSRPTSR